MKCRAEFAIIIFFSPSGSKICQDILSPLPALILYYLADCILGVTFFGGVAPDNFGVFDLAFVTMFRIAGGEPWPWDSLPAQNADGSTNYGVICFFVSYIVLVNWTLLQVRKVMHQPNAY